jgi:hypothetical protein
MWWRAKAHHRVLTGDNTRLALVATGSQVGFDCMREKNGRAKRYKESCCKFKHWKSPFPAHSRGTDSGSAFRSIPWENGFVAEEKRGGFCRSSLETIS